MLQMGSFVVTHRKISSLLVTCRAGMSLYPVSSCRDIAMISE